MKARLVLCSCLLSVVAATVCVVPCQAAEYYVDARHAQAADENSGRETSPWKTISRAVQVARAGDTVWIKAGKYREGVRYFAHSGEYYASELRFITLAAYRNDAVIIDGTRKVDPGEWKLKEGAKNVFWIALPEDPNQVFVGIAIVLYGHGAQTPCETHAACVGCSASMTSSPNPKNQRNPWPCPRASTKTRPTWRAPVSCCNSAKSSRTSTRWPQRVRMHAHDW